jgi:hypothetical protein
MSKYENTKYGTMNVDKKDNEEAVDALDYMVWQLQTAKSHGGFNHDQIISLVTKWFRVGRFLRSPHYARFNYPLFVREAPAPPKGKKASEVLMEALRNLRSYPYYAGADVHSLHFNEAEKAIVTLIGEYRKAADAERVQYFFSRIQVAARNDWF